MSDQQNNLPAPEARETIKNNFRTGAFPTEQQFAELIDAFVHRDHESGQSIGLGTGDPKNILDVVGNVAIGDGFAGSFRGPDQGLIVKGRTGINNHDPQAELHVSGSAIIEGDGLTLDGGGLTIGGIQVIDENGEWHDKLGIQGQDGENGKDGADGKDGKDGKDGADGKEN